jgi:lysozyme
MDISAAGLTFIAGWEKYMPRPYKDIDGNITWGYGHKQKPGETPPTFISPADALTLLRSDAEVFVKIANANIRVSLSQNQFDAFCSILYNVGPGWKSVKDGIIVLKTGKPSTLLLNINARNYTGAAAQFLQWDRAGGRVVQGLLNRRMAERKLWLTPPLLTAPQ